jgi:hypothetical protein
MAAGGEPVPGRALKEFSSLGQSVMKEQAD